MSTKRALVCSYYPPEFDRDSGSRRVLDLIEFLCADGWTVCFVASHRMSDPRYCRALQQLGVAVFNGAKIEIEQLLSTARFDLALFAYWPVAEIYLPILRRASPRTRVIVDSVDLHFLRNARRLFQAAAGRLDAAGLDANYGSELIRELNVYAEADAVLTVSRKEADLLNDFVGKPGLAHCVPDKEEPAGAGLPLNERRGILFLGSFRHEPNIGAVEFLCKEIVPHINPALTARHPIYIVGEKLDETVRRFGEGLPQVRMVGWVPSPLPYLERVRLSVIPLRYGAGTKRKLLQALTAGTPTVSTSVGIEGFDLTDGEDVLVADEPRRFAAAIVSLLTDSAEWERLARQGRERLLATHGREAVLARLRAVVQRVLTSVPAAPAAAVSLLQQPARLDMFKYQQVRESIQQVVKSSLPPDATILVISRGDDELLKLNGCRSWHFPQTDQGVYAGCHPGNSAEAIAHLEALRAKGGQFLLLPSTAFWWLDYYQEFRQHLDHYYTEVVHQDGVCVIYRLEARPQAPVRPSQISEKPALPPPGPAPETPTETPVRLIAFHLPQFHPIPENDAWWGEGFTEWTNVGKALPLFPDHYQPHLPADLGFYDLRLADTRQEQADLARQYGIHGFCYYHYWFNGKRLLDRPFAEILASGKPEFPFCLCWANEPWSRRWNGRPEEVLQAQVYSPEDDLAHIRWLLPALADLRAIRIEGKPALLIYQGRDLPEPARTVAAWRREVARAGLPGLYLLSVETGWDAGWDATQVGFDAKVLFQPQFTMLFNSGAQIPIPGKDSLRVFDYQKAWPVLAKPEPVSYRRYDTVFPSWDNSPRTGDKGVVLHNSSPAAYRQWLSQAIAKARQQPPEHRLVFVNAWNEWGEGCHLEPDLKNGRAYLEATAAALAASPAHLTVSSL